MAKTVKPGMDGKQMRQMFMGSKKPMQQAMPMRKHKKMTVKQDEAYDKAHGIKEGSRRDLALDKLHGVKDKKAKKSVKGKKLTYAERKGLPKSAFVFPATRRYPIQDEDHARNALARSSGKPEEAEVRAVVHRRYPGIK